MKLCKYIWEPTSYESPHLQSHIQVVPILSSLYPSRIFPFLPSPVHLTRVSFYFFPSFLAIFILMSSNNNNITWNRNPFPPASLPFLSCCHRTTTNQSGAVMINTFRLFILILGCIYTSYSGKFLLGRYCIVMNVPIFLEDSANKSLQKLSSHLSARFN